MIFEFVVFEIFLVKVGVIIDDIMLKKLNMFKVVLILIFGVFLFS